MSIFYTKYALLSNVDLPIFYPLNFPGTWQRCTLLSFFFISHELAFFFFLDFIFCLTFTKCWNDLHVLAEALLVRAVMDHLFLEAINQPELTRIWGGAAMGGGGGSVCVCEGHLTWFSSCLLGALLIDVVEISADCVTISGQGWLLFGQPFPDFSWELVLPTFKISYRHQHELDPHCLRCATQQDQNEVLA